MKIETVDYTGSDAGERLARSLRETGFAVLANHPIRANRIDEAYALWGGFFASDSKLNYYATMKSRMDISRLSLNMPKTHRKKT